MSMAVAPAQGPMVCLQGQGVARGIAIGRAVVMTAVALEVAHYRIPRKDVAQECERLRDAIRTARGELDALAADLPPDAPRELGPLLNVHSLLLGDPLLTEQVCALIHQQCYNAEWALASQGQVLVEQFAVMSDDYLRERGADVRQVIERVLRVLSGAPPALLPEAAPVSADEGLIVVARDIAPADMLRLRDGRFAAFLTDLGGAASHTAILARSMNVPAVVGLAHARALLRDGDVLAIDGASGAVLVNPSRAVLDEFIQRRDALAREHARRSGLRDAPALTLDGISVALHANIELPHEAAQALQAGAQGIGLFRTEFLFMGRHTIPGEEEQTQAYARVIETMAGRSVTIRTLDIGADKVLDSDETVATNPALGLRAIRYCLARPEMFIVQLRALLRASRHGHVRILIPMLTSLDEVIATRQALAAAVEQLRQREPDLRPDYSLGAMVETPAVAIAVEPFAEALDFLSLGTNDLIQYTLAVDRADSAVAELYDPLHPAVLRLIAHVINVGERLGKPVAMCGEMAGDASLTRLLLGLGLTTFSMHAQQLPDVKHAIMNAHTTDLRYKVASTLNRAQRIDLSSLSA